MLIIKDEINANQVLRICKLVEKFLTQETISMLRGNEITQNKQINQ